MSGHLAIGRTRLATDFVAARHNAGNEAMKAAQAKLAAKQTRCTLCWIVAGSLAAIVLATVVVL